MRRACGLTDSSRRVPHRASKEEMRGFSLPLSLSLLSPLFFPLTVFFPLLFRLLVSFSSQHLVFHTFFPAAGSANRPFSLILLVLCRTGTSVCTTVLFVFPLNLILFYFKLPSSCSPPEQLFSPAASGNHDHRQGGQCAVESGSAARPGTVEVFSSSCHRRPASGPREAAVTFHSHRFKSMM